MIGSRYLIRHDAIVVPDFSKFMKSPHVGDGLFQLFRDARHEEASSHPHSTTEADKLLTEDGKSFFWMAAARERVEFLQSCIDGLDEDQLAGHKRLGGYLSSEEDMRARNYYRILMNTTATQDRTGFENKIKLELSEAIKHWDELVSWAEADEPGERPYFPPLENCYEEGIYEFSHFRDAIGYAVSGFLRLTETGLIDYALLAPYLVQLEAIDERYRRALGDRRDVRTPQSMGGFRFYPAEFWWHHPVK